MKEKKKINLGYFYVFASAVFFSLAGILIKTITWSSFTINGTRNLLAFVVMALYLKKKRHKIIINKAVIFGSFCNLFMNLTFVMATKLTSAANAIVLQFTEPIFLILFLWIIWKQKPDKKAVFACAFVFFGILCFFFDKLTLDGQIGNLLAVISGVLYAFVFLMKKIKHADFESSIIVSQLISFFIFIPWYFRETDYRPRNFILIVIMGVIQMGLAYILLAKGLEKTSPVSASLTLMIEPILNPILVAVFYGEMMNYIAIVGAAIVIITSSIYNVLSAKEHKKENLNSMSQLPDASQRQNDKIMECFYTATSSNSE